MSGVMQEAQSLSSQAPQGGAPQPSGTTRSLLMVDCGSVYTKVALIGQVEGRYRLLARTQESTTIAPPRQDLAAGLRHAIAALERTTGRTLLRDDRLITPQQDDGSGVDGLALATSVGGPLRLLTSGPGREALAGLLHRALGGLFVQAEALPGYQKGLPTNAPEWQQALAQVRALHPHALVIVGPPFGASRGQHSMEETAAVASRWLDALYNTPVQEQEMEAPSHALPVIFTGSGTDAAPLTAAMRGRASAVQIVDELTPSTLAPLTRAIGSLYEGAVLRGQPGYHTLRALSSAAPTACVTALSGMARYLAHHFQTNVVAVDVGAGSTSLAGATARGELLPACHPTAGVGPGAGAILRARGALSVARWLSAPSTEDEVREYVLTRMLRPRALPATPRELELEHALAREAITLALRAPGSRIGGLHPLDVVVGTGGVLANVPSPAMAALILLDALQPRDILSLVLDTGHISNMLGGVATLDSTAAAEVAESDAVLLQLGTFVSPVGAVPDGQPMLRVSLEYADGHKHVEDVAQGTLLRLPLQPNEPAILGLYPAETVDVGLGPGQQARATEPVEGGALGLVIDARGRPLTLPQGPAERAARQAEWRRALGLEA